VSVAWVDHDLTGVGNLGVCGGDRLDARTGEELGKHWRRQSVVAFDVTVSAPKDVSILYALGDERTLKEFGFGLATAVFLDALVVRCVLLPAVLELLGPTTWRLPRWLDARLPHINIEGSTARAARAGERTDLGDAPEPTPAKV